MREKKLWYRSPANHWNEALPLGNGRIGMMVYGGITEERIQLNEETVWSGWQSDEYDNPETYEHLDEMRQMVFAGEYAKAQELCNKYMVCRGRGNSDITSAFGAYQTAGDLYVTLPDTAGEGYKRELYLNEGRARVICDENEREYFISYKYNTAVVRIRNVGDKAKLRYERQNTMIVQDKNEILAVGCIPQKFCVLIRHNVVDNDLYVYITAATKYETELDPVSVCKKTLDEAINAGFDELLEDTKSYFSSILGRSEFILNTCESKENVPTNERIENPEGDLGLVELYFNFGKYLLLGSSQGKLPANLQGVWCNDYLPPWSSDYHININIQMNYWFAEICDMPELITPFFNLIKKISIHGRKTAEIAYKCPGWVAHFATNPWGYTSLGRMPLYGAFVTAGAWCLRHVKERWLFSGDDEILREFYPVIKGASEFFASYLVRDPRNGYLVTAPASSPENSFIDPKTREHVNICAGPTMDTSIIRELFEFNILAASVLEIDAEFASELKEKVLQLMPISIGKHGQIMEWSEDFDEQDPGHRHISHLYGLYPADQIRQSTPEIFEAAKNTIKRRLSNGGGHTGWSRAWIINFYARLANGDKAYENIVELLKKSTFSNMFDSHPYGKSFVFQIDGNFGGTAGICEMLLQSHDGCIDLLPALPDAWHDGEFKGFKARGGFRVSAKWKDGKVVYCKVEGENNKQVKLKINGNIIELNGNFVYDKTK